jgi:hypothetical protein
MELFPLGGSLEALHFMGEFYLRRADLLEQEMGSLATNHCVVEYPSLEEKYLPTGVWAMAANRTSPTPHMGTSHNGKTHADG